MMFYQAFWTPKENVPLFYTDLKVNRQLISSSVGHKSMLATLCVCKSDFDL